MILVVELETTALLTICVLIPFILRLGGDWILLFMLRTCCNLIQGYTKLPDKIGSFPIIKVYEKKYIWETVVQRGLNLTGCSLFLLSLIRLLFCHLMQPILYFIIIHLYWDSLYHAQQTLAIIVGLREGIYLLLTIFGICVNSTYLLVDAKAGWNESFYEAKHVYLYVIAPEIYLFNSVFKLDGCCYKVGYIFLFLLDLVAIIVFIWSFVVKNVYVPLIIGYGITTIGISIFIIFYIVLYVIFEILGNRSSYDKYDYY